MKVGDMSCEVDDISDFSAGICFVTACEVDDMSSLSSLYDVIYHVLVLYNNVPIVVPQSEV